VVETYARFTPVIVTPLVSFTVARMDCWKFWFTTMSLLMVFGTLRVTVCGGHVAKNPAELPAFDRLELIIVAPGC
jgi:hypothetical protein